MKSILVTPIRELLDWKQAFSSAQENPNSTSTIHLNSVQLENNLVVAWSYAKESRNMRPRVIMARSESTYKREELNDSSAYSTLENQLHCEIFSVSLVDLGGSRLFSITFCTLDDMWYSSVGTSTV